MVAIRLRSEERVRTNEGREERREEVGKEVRLEEGINQRRS